MPLIARSEKLPEALSGKSRPFPPQGRAFVVAFLVLLYLVMGWRGREPTMIRSSDELTYLALSQSIETGSYREIYRASAPFHTKYPPAYPAWLAVVRGVAGDHLDIIRAANLALTALTLVLLFGVVQRLAGTGLALALLLPLALSHGMLMAGGSLMSEAPFLFLSTATLAACVPTGRSPRWSGYAVIALALLAFLTRSAGITLVLAVGVWLWSRRRRAELAAYAGTSGLVVGGWFLYTALLPHDGVGRSYASDFASDSRGTHTAGLIERLAKRAWHNAVEYGAKDLPFSLSLPTLPGTVVDNLVWVGACAVFLTVGFVVLWRVWRVAAAYLLLYAGLLLAWPWPDPRLLLPVVPLALLAFLLGARRVVGRLPVRARNPVFGVLVTLLAIGALRLALERDATISQCDRANPGTSPGCYDDDTRSMVAAARYIRDHAGPGDLVLTAKPPSMYFLSGHRTEPSWLLLQRPAAETSHALREWKIRFVLLTGLLPYETELLAPMLLTSCREFQVEASLSPHTLLLSTSPSRETADACASLTAYVRVAADEEHLRTP